MNRLLNFLKTVAEFVLINLKEIVSITYDELKYNHEQWQKR